MSDILWAAAKALLVALILTPILRDVFRSYNVVDRPGRRKVHVYPIPRLGGIAIAAAYAISVLGRAGSGQKLATWNLVAAAAVIFATGLLDDFFTLAPGYKLVGQVGAAVLAFWGGVRLGLLPLWLALPVTVFWLLLTTNAFNLIDGMDGLCAGAGLVGAGALFGAAVLQNNVPLERATLPLAGALLGFIGFNFSPATVFLGDSGALLIGFLLGCDGLLWTQNAFFLHARIAEPGHLELSVLVPGLLVPLLMLALPLLDASLSVARRFVRNRPVFSADRGHIHHRVLDREQTPARAALVLYLWASAGAGFGLLLAAPAVRPYYGLAILGAAIAAWTGILWLRYPELQVPSKLFYWGEFRKSLARNVRAEQLLAGWTTSSTEDERWTVLVDVGRDAGWSRVKWTRDGSVRRETSLPGPAPSWTFRLTLNQHDSIEIEGPLAAAQAVDLAAFAHAACRSLATGPSLAVERAVS